MDAIKQKDFRALSSYVGDAGLRLSPAGSVEATSDIVISKSNLSNWLSGTTAITFGSYPGSGADITLTPSEYYDKFLYPVDFLSQASISINETEALSQIREVYPGAQAVSYMYPGAVDWKELTLIFTQADSSFILEGILYRDTSMS